MPRYKCTGQTTILWSHFSLSTSAWVLGIKLSSPGSCGKHYYPLHRLSGFRGGEACPEKKLVQLHYNARVNSPLPTRPEPPHSAPACSSHARPDGTYILNLWDSFSLLDVLGKGWGRASGIGSETHLRTECLTLESRLGFDSSRSLMEE